MVSTNVAVVSKRCKGSFYCLTSFKVFRFIWTKYLIHMFNLLKIACQLKKKIGRPCLIKYKRETAQFVNQKVGNWRNVS